MYSTWKEAEKAFNLALQRQERLAWLWHHFHIKPMKVITKGGNHG